MTDQKSVLVVGLDPRLIDFSQPGYPPGMRIDASRIRRSNMPNRLGDTAVAVVQTQLKRNGFDCVLIGAGVRTNPSHLMLFEQLINVVDEHAPQAKLCFNQLPSDIAEAVKRWL